MSWIAARRSRGCSSSRLAGRRRILATARARCRRTSGWRSVARVMAILARDPSAGANPFYPDVVPVNLYRAPDDVSRVHGVFKSIQSKSGVDKPVWLTETNAMPSDDRAIPCADKHTNE